ncbi:MAG: hypothetical protein HY747_02735, partial [Elusimicrobia bacterium]|nr:hypothetical protein [Elusimicrobiota bacterium]
MAAELKEEILKEVFEKIDEAFGSKIAVLLSSQQAAAAKLSEIERFWNMLMGDLKELSASVAAMKGVTANLEAVVTGKIRLEFESRLEDLARNWSAQLAQQEARLMEKSEEGRERSAADAERRLAARQAEHERLFRGEVFAIWTREARSAADKFSSQLRELPELKQIRAIEERLAETERGLLALKDSAS